MMASPHPGASGSKPSPTLLNLLDDTAFRDAVDAALERTAHGRPGALLHLDIARASDIQTACGEDGLAALRDLLFAIVYNQLGPAPPIAARPPGALALLLPDVLPADAVVLAKRLRGSLDKGTFTWHGHPFRLGAHIGLVELGPDPRQPEAWIRRAQEACAAAQELGGSGIQMMARSDHAWNDLEREREWHKHLTEVI